MKYFITAIYSVILVLSTSGCFTGSLWVDDGGHMSYPKSFEIQKIDFDYNSKTESIDIKTQVSYETRFIIFPALFKNQGQIDTWQVFVKKHIEIDQYHYTLSNFKRNFISRYQRFVVPQNIDTPKLPQNISSVIIIKNGIHPDDIELLKAQPFFLYEKNKNLNNLFVYAYKICIWNSEEGWIGTHLRRIIPITSEHYKRSNFIVTTEKIILTPINVVADIVTTPIQIPVFFFGYFFSPSRYMR